jgi:hypothetical protein
MRRPPVSTRHDKLPRQSLVRTPAFVLALLIGTALRFAALPLPGAEGVASRKIWAYAASDQVTIMYGVGGSPPARGVAHWGTRAATVDGPPAALYELGLVGRVYRVFDPEFRDTPLLLVLLKVPGLLSAAALTGLIYMVVLRRTGRKELAQWSALACWLNPALILSADALGHWDPLMLLPAVAALMLVHAEAPAAAGAMTAVAALTEPQGVLILPAVLVAAWALTGPGGLARAALGITAAALLLLLPFAMAGALPNMWFALSAFQLERDVLSANAANVWWIAGWAIGLHPLLSKGGLAAALKVQVPHTLTIARFRELGLPDPRPWAAGAAALVCGRACWQVRSSRSLALHAALGAFTVQAFFVLMIGVHEHHQMLAVPLLALAAGLRRAFRPLFYTVTVIVALNLNLFHGISQGYGWAIPRALTWIDATVLLSLANVITLVTFAGLLADEALSERSAHYTPYEERRQA